MGFWNRFKLGATAIVAIAGGLVAGPLGAGLAAAASTFLLPKYDNEEEEVRREKERIDKLNKEEIEKNLDQVREGIAEVEDILEAAEKNQIPIQEGDKEYQRVLDKIRWILNM